MVQFPTYAHKILVSPSINGYVCDSCPPIQSQHSHSVRVFVVCVDCTVVQSAHIAVDDVFGTHMCPKQYATCDVRTSKMRYSLDNRIHPRSYNEIYHVKISRFSLRHLDKMLGAKSTERHVGSVLNWVCDVCYQKTNLQR